MACAYEVTSYGFCKKRLRKLTIQGIITAKRRKLDTNSIIISTPVANFVYTMPNPSLSKGLFLPMDY